MKLAQTTLSGILLLAIVLLTVGVGIFPRNTSAADPDYASQCLTESGLSALGDKILGFISGALNKTLGFLTFGLFDGGPQQVISPTADTLAFKIDLKSCLRYVTDQVAKTALQKFKKRLLDKMTDDIVAWIRDDGSGKPRFVDDFSGFLKDTADESLGQTVEALGYSNLCSGNLSARLQLQLQQPKEFTEQVNCTLKDVIKNVSNFDRDFRAGGWIGYAETLKPQNNRWGLEILATDQAARLQAKQELARQNEILTGGGYKSEKACYEWGRRVVDASNRISEESIYPAGGGWDDQYYDLRNGSLIPTSTTGVRASKWLCTKELVTTPGSTAQTLINHALSENDTAYVANTTDLTPYISAVFDAAINRLFKEGVNGLRSLSSDLLSESGTGRTPETWSSGRDPRDRRYGGYGSEYGTSSDPSAQLKDAILKTIASTTQRMRVASSSLLTLIPLNNRLIASTTGPLLPPLQSLTQCEVAKTFDHVQCPSTGAIETNNTNRANVIQSQLDSFKTLSGQLQQVRTATNDPAISVASLTELVAVVNNVFLSIENVNNNIVPSFVFDINSVASSTVNPRLRACQAAVSYVCPL